MQSRLLKTSDVARRLNVCCRTAGRLCASGALEALRVGHLWRVSEESLRAYEERCRHRPAVVSPPSHRREEEAKRLVEMMIAERRRK